MKRIITSVVWLVALSISVSFAQSDVDPAPEEVLARFTAAFNSGDYEAAAAFFAEDAVVTFVPAFFQAPILSRQELLGTFNGLREMAPQMEVVVQQWLGDDVVITSTRQWDNETLGMGIEGFEFTEVYVVRGGLIHAATSIMTRESLVVAAEAMEAMNAD